jgi:hypothetical protein
VDKSATSHSHSKTFNMYMQILEYTTFPAVGLLIFFFCYKKTHEKALVIVIELNTTNTGSWCLVSHSPPFVYFPHVATKHHGGCIGRTPSHSTN